MKMKYILLSLLLSAPVLQGMHISGARNKINSLSTIKKQMKYKVSTKSNKFSVGDIFYYLFRPFFKQSETVKEIHKSIVDNNAFWNLPEKKQIPRISELLTKDPECALFKREFYSNKTIFEKALIYAKSDEVLTFMYKAYIKNNINFSDKDKEKLRSIVKDNKNTVSINFLSEYNLNKYHSEARHGLKAMASR